MMRTSDSMDSSMDVCVHMYKCMGCVTKTCAVWNLRSGVLYLGLYIDMWFHTRVAICWHVRVYAPWHVCTQIYIHIFLRMKHHLCSVNQEFA